MQLLPLTALIFSLLTGGSEKCDSHFDMQPETFSRCDQTKDKAESGDKLLDKNEPTESS